MLMITQTALELGFLYALVAMALFLSFRILNIADMTTDGCFVLGAAVSVTLAAGGHPILAIPAAMLAGSCAGFVTAFLQTRLGIPSILAGIVTNTGLYTVNLMAMGWKANQSLLGGSTIFTLLRDSGIGGDYAAARRHGYADRGQAGGSQRLFSHRALRHFSGKIFADHHRQCGIQGPDPGGLRGLCHCGAVPPSAADGGRAGVETGIVQRSNHAGNPGGDPGQ